VQRACRTPRADALDAAKPLGGLQQLYAEPAALAAGRDPQLERAVEVLRSFSTEIREIPVRNVLTGIPRYSDADAAARLQVLGPRQGAG
jgi:hypothetical protein